MQMTMLRPILLAATALFVWTASAAAQMTCEGYPRRPVTIVVPFPAGSATDAVARKVGEGLQQQLGQNFVVENKAGADGIVAARAIVDAAPDGPGTAMPNSLALAGARVARQPMWLQLN